MPTNRLKIALLGEPRFECDGCAFAFSAPPAALPLLVYLLLNRDAPVYRAAACNLFWPNATPEVGRANLRRHIHYIKKALPRIDGVEWLDVGYATVRWNTSAPYWLDVEAFTQAAADPQTHGVAMELYAGDLLANFVMPFLERARFDLRATYRRLLQHAAARAIEASRYHEATVHLGRLLDSDPWNESALRELLRAKIRSGGRAEALAQFKEYCERLKAQFGVEPATETLNVIRLARAIGVT